MTIQDNINCRDSAGRNSTPLHLAAGYNNLEVAEYLLEQVRCWTLPEGPEKLVKYLKVAEYLLEQVRNCTLPEVPDKTVQYLEVEA